MGTPLGWRVPGSIPKTPRRGGLKGGFYPLRGTFASGGGRQLIRGAATPDLPKRRGGHLGAWIGLVALPILATRFGANVLPRP